jgi:hypothetical protein
MAEMIAGRSEEVECAWSVLSNLSRSSPHYSDCPRARARSDVANIERGVNYAEARPAIYKRGLAYLHQVRPWEPPANSLWRFYAAFRRYEEVTRLRPD